jgi:hypothetical protein
MLRHACHKLSAEELEGVCKCSHWAYYPEVCTFVFRAKNEFANTLLARLMHFFCKCLILQGLRKRSLRRTWPSQGPEYQGLTPIGPEKLHQSSLVCSTTTVSVVRPFVSTSTLQIHDVNSIDCPTWRVVIHTFTIHKARKAASGGRKRRIPIASTMNRTRFFSRYRNTDVCTLH